MTNRLAKPRHESETRPSSARVAQPSQLARDRDFCLPPHSSCRTPRLAQSTRADAEKDPVLKAMLDELDRSMTHLQLPGFEKPFFIQYRIEDVEDFETRAELRRHRRLISSSHAARRPHHRPRRRLQDRQLRRPRRRRPQMAAIDDDPIALRSALWTATDQAYKNALAAYAQKQAELKQVQTPPQADDFSKEKPSSRSPRRSQPQARRSCLGRPRRPRQRPLPHRPCRQAPAQHDIQYSTAAFPCPRHHHRGSSTAKAPSCASPRRSYQESFGWHAGRRRHAPRSLVRHQRRRARRSRSRPRLSTSTPSTLIASLDDLRKAPLVEEEYHGPVLLSADASADTLHSPARHRSDRHPPAPRNRSAHQRPLRIELPRARPARLHQRRRRSRLKTFDGKDLVGAYDVDDEGVPAQAVKLVADGQLENYLIGRTPCATFLNPMATAAPLSPARRALPSASSRSRPKTASPTTN